MTAIQEFKSLSAAKKVLKEMQGWDKARVVKIVNYEGKNVYAIKVGENMWYRATGYVS